jgi:hypothetical protein
MPDKADFSTKVLSGYTQTSNFETSAFENLPLLSTSVFSSQYLPYWCHSFVMQKNRPCQVRKT